MEIGSAGSFLGPTEQLRRIGVRTITSGDVITWTSPCGNNCSYTISFTGPAYKCQALDSLPSTVNLTGAGQAPNFFVADTIWNGDLSDQGLWIARGIAPPSPKITHCQLFESIYVVNVQYSENLPAFSASVSYQDQIPGSIYDVYNNLNPSPRNWTLFNYFAIQQAVSDALIGTITVSSVYGGFNFQTTLIGISSLAVIAPFNITYPGNFENLLTDLLLNTTLSVNNFLLDPPIPQLAGENATGHPAILTPVTATIVTYPATYSYSWRNLWAIYGTALVVTAVCVCIGSYMLVRNGVDSSLSFSQVMVTTRNEALDRECFGAWMGGEYIPQRLFDLRLKYGGLSTKSFENGGQLLSDGRAAFGHEDEIMDL